MKHLLEIWPNIVERKGTDKLWGDEVEYLLLCNDLERQEVHLALRQDETLEKLNKKYPNGLWQPEFGRYMVESSPEAPYSNDIKGLLGVEADLRSR